MRMEILGCNGGIGGELRTMCLRVDNDLLIDAGSGAGDLSLTQIIAVNTVFLTHSHLDHCGFLPLLADAAANFRDTPLNIYALPETIAAIKRNILNGEIWPDYSAPPSPDHPYLTFPPLQPGALVLAVDELSQRSYVDGQVIQIGGEENFRLVEDGAPHDDIARSLLPHLQAGKDEMGGRGADVYADTGELDLVLFDDVAAWGGKTSGHDFLGETDGSVE